MSRLHRDSEQLLCRIIEAPLQHSGLSQNNGQGFKIDLEMHFRQY